MRITLAGYNLDAEIIDLFHRAREEYRHGSVDSPVLSELLDCLADEPLTPETLSAAYARISRSDKGVGGLRRDARSSVARARQSNERIVFGLGHASVAEHAVFNLDITGISRLALEELEAHRLASYTEASQRYIAMGGDFIVPEEVGRVGWDEQFTKLCEELFSGYRELIGKLEKLHTDLSERDRNTRAREDARYVLPLSCRSQVGVTVNARTAEWMIRSFNRSQLAEVRRMGEEMLAVIKRVVPSLIRYTEQGELALRAERELAHAGRNLKKSSTADDEKEVSLVDSPTGRERMALAALMFRTGQDSFSDCLRVVDKLDEDKCRGLLVTAHRYLTAHEPLQREMELGVFTFSVTLSAAAFAQFKRHRLATLIKQDYLPELGVSIPLNVERCGGRKLFDRCNDISSEAYEKLRAKLPEEESPAASYALTNAHRRRVVFQANARELTHLSRLREDSHAQWDIRGIAVEMIRLAREACPALMMFAAGKDSFDRLQAGVLK